MNKTLGIMKKFCLCLVTLIIVITVPIGNKTKVKKEKDKYWFNVMAITNEKKRDGITSDKYRSLELYNVLVK